MVAILLAAPVFAANPSEGITATQTGLNATAGIGGFNVTNTSTPVNIIAGIIKILLGLLGVIFMILIIVSGFQWMGAGGNKEAVGKAQTRIKNATIGLIIVLLAWIITAFIISRLALRI